MFSVEFYNNVDLVRYFRPLERWHMRIELDINVLGWHLCCWTILATKTRL